MNREEAIARRFHATMRERFGSTWVGDHPTSDAFVANRSWRDLLRKYDGETIHQALHVLADTWTNQWAPKHHEMARILAEARAVTDRQRNGGDYVTGYWRSVVLAEVWGLLFLKRMVGEPSGTLDDLPPHLYAPVRQFVQDLTGGLVGREQKAGERSPGLSLWVQDEADSFVASLVSRSEGVNSGS